MVLLFDQLFMVFLDELSYRTDSLSFRLIC